MSQLMQWSKFPDLAIYCCDVNEFRLRFRSNDNATIDFCYQYHFAATDVGLNASPECTGEVHLLTGVIGLSDLIIGLISSNAHASFNVRVWPKINLHLSTESWINEEKIKSIILNSFDDGQDRTFYGNNYFFPKSLNDIDVFNINGRVWGTHAIGDFESENCFYTELTEHLIIMVDFDASSCWPNDAPPPADIKSHVMGFFLDYLNHFDIILRDSVPEEQLPPLGFYPSRRDEKEIDAEGKTIESRSEAYASESLLKW